MTNKNFIVKLEIEAPSEEYVENMLERMPHADRIFDDEIIDPEAKHFEARIRYEEDWNGQGEHFVFENKWSDEDEWSLDTAFKLLDYKSEKAVLLRYEALTKIRELMRNSIPFHFSSK